MSRVAHVARATLVTATLLAAGTWAVQGQEEDPDLDLSLAESTGGPARSDCLAGVTGPFSSFVDDVDGDGESETVELFALPPTSHLPALARWRPLPGGRLRDARWAATTHLLVSVSPDAVWTTTGTIVTSLAGILGRQDLVLSSLGAEGVFRLGFPRFSPDLAKLARSGALLKALPALRALNAGRAVVEPDYLLFPDAVPHDPKYRFQNAMPLLRAPTAWDHATGSDEAVLAVLDSGIEHGHPSLVNSTVKVYSGSPFANVVAGNDDVTDDLDHGTYCAAIAGAKGDDHKGMAGVNWSVTLLPVKMMDADGCADNGRAVAAITYAIAHGADVIAASWGGFGETTALSDAIAGAGVAGIVFVASAGNSATNLDTADYYPASYRLPNMIVVGSCDGAGTRQPMSGYGAKNVDLSAPGHKVYSAVRGGNYYDKGGGTSAAVAFVAGAAALVLAADPSLRDDPKAIRCRLLQSTNTAPGLSTASCSGGRLDLANAVTGGNLHPACDCP